MTLLEKLKRALGLAPDDEGGTDTALTVEREAGEAGEVGGDESRAVRAGEPDETTGAGGAVDSGADSEGDDEPVATDTEAAASTGSMVESDAGDSPAEAAEPAEAAGPASDDREIDDDSEDGGAGAGADGAEAEPESDSASEPSSEPEPSADADPVEELTGIGPAYGERLRGIGIETVADLAAADAADIAAETDIGEGRASTWIERARER